MWGAPDVAFLLGPVTLVCKFTEQNSFDMYAVLYALLHYTKVLKANGRKKTVNMFPRYN